METFSTLPILSLGELTLCVSFLVLPQCMPQMVLFSSYDSGTGVYGE
jgi:hypothetical protein